jgi:hypothetical protein
MLVKNSNNINKTNNNLALNSNLWTQKNTTYDKQTNPDPGFEKVHKCGYVKPVNGNSTLSILIIGY